MSDKPANNVPAGDADEPATTTAIKKLEALFTSLDEAERAVVSQMVRASLIQAASKFEGDKVANVPGAIEAFPVDDYVTGLTGSNAPNLVKSLSLPGSLVAYSIPGCNRSALVAIKAQFLQ